MTVDEQRALAFIAGLLCLSAAVRFIGLPDPVEMPGGGQLDLAAHIEEVEGAVAEAEEAARPLEPGEVIDPNTATAAELMRLPRVGPALAERILADRDANGRYRSLDQLGRVPGIGERTLELLAPHVDLRPAPFGAGARVRTGVGSGSGSGAGSRGGAGSVSGSGDGFGEGAPIDLNRASVDELVALPGVGPVLARRIVAYRDSAGPFGSVSELASVKGIGAATLERIRDRVRIR